MPRAKLKAVDTEGSMERRKQTTLSMPINHKLIDLILAEYKSSGLSDKAFAEYATTKLELPMPITNSHIATRRQEFGIESNKNVAALAPDAAALAAMVLAHEATITDLKERVATLEAWVNNTFPSKGPKPAV